MTRIALLVTALAACHSSAGTTFTGAFAQCAKADLGSVVSDLEAEVASLIAANGSGLEAGILGLGVKAGYDAVGCAISAAEAALAAAEGGGSGGSAVGFAAPSWRVGVSRARAAIARTAVAPNR